LSADLTEALLAESSETFKSLKNKDTEDLVWNLLFYREQIKPVGIRRTDYE
jgi:hypothetical protein